MIDRTFWKNKKVFITGHTGFKGSWLSLWLSSMGAEVMGYALKPPTVPSLFNLCKIEELVTSIEDDIRNIDSLKKYICSFKPEVIFHLAAQPIVSESYKNPLETYEINVMGTVNLLEAVRNCSFVKAVVNITSDKCYENREWYWGYRETDKLGGYDPYSNSKACSELIVSAYRNSFFNPKDYEKHGVGIATARAGNVIGGGDWAKNRLIPDCIRSLLKREKIIIRSPNAMRPWQHVIEPLRGYLMLAEKLYKEGRNFASAWNFGPKDEDMQTVEWIVKRLCYLWEESVEYQIEKQLEFHEASLLRLDCSKARYILGWKPEWSIETSLEKVVDWVKAYKESENMYNVCIRQIKEYMHSEDAGNGKT